MKECEYVYNVRENTVGIRLICSVLVLYVQIMRIVLYCRYQVILQNKKSKTTNGAR